MDQATQTADPAAPPEARALEPAGSSLQQAHSLAGRIIEQLTTLPRDIDICRELDGTYGVHVMWSRDVSGVCALAQWAGASWELVSSDTGPGVYAETRPRIDGIDIWAWTLLSQAEAEQARNLMMLPPEQPAAETEPCEEQPAATVASTVQPLGASVVAVVPVVTATSDGTE